VLDVNPLLGAAVAAAVMVAAIELVQRKRFWEKTPPLGCCLWGCSLWEW